MTVPRDHLWWLHEENRAVRIGDMKLVAAKGDPWELYDLSRDRAESDDLAADRPETVTRMAKVWEDQLNAITDLAAKTVLKKK